MRGGQGGGNMRFQDSKKSEAPLTLRVAAKISVTLLEQVFREGEDGLLAVSSRLLLLLVVHRHDELGLAAHDEHPFLLAQEALPHGDRALFVSEFQLLLLCDVPLLSSDPESVFGLAALGALFNASRFGDRHLL